MRGRGVLVGLEVTGVAVIVLEHAGGGLVAAGRIAAATQGSARRCHDSRNDADPEEKLNRSHPLLHEARLALSFGGVGMIGFCVDAAALHFGLMLGLAAWSARIVSLFLAMQATFTINGLFVFRSFERGRIERQWIGYMLANGFGNFCNYWIFLTLVSTHWPGLSNHYAALAIGSLSAWAINFAGTRLFVFRRLRAPLETPKTLDAPKILGPDGPSPGPGPV
jgi:putative flippase GtrA